jgi:hypothetical protein
MKELLKAIEAKTMPIGEWMKLSTGPMVQVSDVIDLINTHMEGKVIVLVDDLKILLSFSPQGEVPKGLDPTFYHTLTYDGDCKLQAKVDRVRAMLSTQGEENAQ